MYDPLFFMDVYTQDRDKINEIARDFWAHRNEQVYLGKIPFDLVTTDFEEQTSVWLEKYFTEKEYTFDTSTIKIDKGERLLLDIITKTAYLTKEYLSAGGFRDPLCTHYNPRKDTQVIHPGGTRQIVLELFDAKEINTFYFNTRGAEFDFMKNLQPIDLDECILEGYNVAIVPDHGSLIPHILRIKGYNTNPIGMTTMHRSINSRFTNKDFKIASNYEIEFLQPWLTTKTKKSNIDVFFLDKQPSRKTMLKAVYLILSGMNYINKDLQVVHKR